MPSRAGLHGNILGHSPHEGSLFTQLFNLTADALITVDSRFRIISVNHGTEQLFEYTADELLGQPLNILMPERFRDVHDIHMSHFAQEARTSRRMGEYIEVYGLRSDGTEFIAEATITRGTYDGDTIFMVVLRDITQRRVTENALAESEARYRLLAENATDLLTRHTVDGGFLYVSPSSFALTGYTPGELTRQTAPELIHADDMEAVLVHRKNLLNDLETVRTVTFRLRHKQGHYVWFESAQRAVRDHARESEITIISISRDVTRQKLLEQELRLALRKERELSELKQRFTSIVSHEFRTPLTIIMSSTEMLQRYDERMPAEKRRARLDKIVRQTTYMRELLDDVTVISKMQAGRAAFSPQPVNLEAFCHDLFLHITEVHEERTRVYFSASGPLDTVSVDERLLQQIVTNLLTNALRYTPEDGVVKLSLHGEDETVQIEIADDGIGIPEEDVEHLFEPFFRATNTTTIEGTGLGLAIVENAVMLHGGTIEVDSTVGVGTVFTITLPRRHPLTD